MSAHIQYGLDRIYREINTEILQRTLFGRNVGQYEIASLDDRIVSEIIRGIVLKDVLMVTGERLVMDLTNIPRQTYPTGTQWVIPSDLLNGRSILQPLAIINRGPIHPEGTMGNANHPGTEKVYLVGPNTIATPQTMLSPHVALRYILSHDANLHNLPVSSQMQFGKLCVLAAKGYVHKELSLSTGFSAFSHGNMSEHIRSIVDEYADSFELYEETEMKRWKKINVFADKKQAQTYTGMFVPR